MIVLVVMATTAATRTDFFFLLFQIEACFNDVLEIKIDILILLWGDDSSSSLAILNSKQMNFDAL